MAHTPKEQALIDTVIALQYALRKLLNEQDMRTDAVEEAWEAVTDSSNVLTNLKTLYGGK